MPVTAGSISIARRINTGDYSHKEAKVELHYTAEGDEDIKVLGAQAAHAALVSLAQVLATVVKIDRTPEIHVPVPDAAPEAEVPAPGEPAKRHRRTKAEMQTAQAVVNPTDPTLPFAASGNSAETQAGGPAGVSASPAVNSSDASWRTDEITDKALNNYCNETMLRIKNKAKIQAVIGEYTQGTVSTIPQCSRAAFMQKLQALQP